MQRRCHGSCSVKVHRYVCFCEASVAISGQSPNPTTSLFLFFIYSLRSTDPTPPPNSQLPTVASKVKTNVVFLLFDHISHSFTNTTLIQQHLCLLPTATSRPSFFSPPVYRVTSASKLRYFLQQLPTLSAILLDSFPFSFYPHFRQRIQHSRLFLLEHPGHFLDAWVHSSPHLRTVHPSLVVAPNFFLPHPSPSFDSNRSHAG